VNMVDGLDGLATGVVGIGALAFFAFCYQLTSLNNASLASTGALLSAMLGGACAGFLPHNINPARLFMGDSGSMLIGLVLSASAITLTGQYSGADLSHGAMGSPASLAPTFLPLALPVTLLVVPIADLVLAVIRRTRAGRSRCDSFAQSPVPRGARADVAVQANPDTCESDLSGWPMDSRTRVFGGATSQASAGCSRALWSSVSSSGCWPTTRPTARRSGRWSASSPASWRAGSDSGCGCGASSSERAS
jgi:hypothetical protein